jgi:regulator of sigma E protease
MEMGARVGMVLLLMLMSFALFNDFQRLISG